MPDATTKEPNPAAPDKAWLLPMCARTFRLTYVYRSTALDPQQLELANLLRPKIWACNKFPNIPRTSKHMERHGFVVQNSLVYPSPIQ